MSVGQIVAAVAAVLVIAFVAWRRRRLSLELKGIGILIALALGVYATGVLSALPDPKKIIEDIAIALGPWTYALVGVMAFLETGAFVGLVAPGETVVIAGGVIAGQGEIELLPLIGLVWVCAILGDTTSFYIGRRLGRGFLEKHGPRVKITHERLEQVESYFDRHGGKTILIGRFIGLVRALAPFIAGSSGLAFRRFIPYSIVGTGLWASVFCVLGFVFWRSFDRVAKIAGQAVFGFGITIAVIVGVVVLYRRRVEIKQWLLAHQRHPLVRPLFAVGRPLYRRAIGPVWERVSPQVRFLWNRVTPGDLGLELTTALAVAGVGLFVFFLYVFELSGDLNPTPLDTELLDLADRLYNDVAVDVAKVVTELGALPTVAILVLGTSVLLATRRRWPEIVVLVGGLALIYVAVHVTKGAVDRPRPADPLVKTALASFPSGHAAYATAWIAVALVFTRRLGLVTNAAVLLGTVAIAAVVGLSRIYLRAHYWSDVAAGWGLGCGIFAGLTAIVLVVEYMRQNGGQREQGPPATPLARVEQ
ncbi:MAG TPA: VTT domain-containing protein [Thermoleophilaceae bacterium]|jgi:membrane protein DedA with SNARE-associated domain/membrane-associated phospholipid phosphatase|nr:VTT domain-containing protein [Thermoleophilaceae bacterium]